MHGSALQKVVICGVFDLLRRDVQVLKELNETAGAGNLELTRKP